MFVDLSLSGRGSDSHSSQEDILLSTITAQVLSTSTGDTDMTAEGAPWMVELEVNGIPVEVNNRTHTYFSVEKDKSDELKIQRLPSRPSQYRKGYMI